MVKMNRMYCHFSAYTPTFAHFLFFLPFLTIPRARIQEVEMEEELGFH